MAAASAAYSAASYIVSGMEDSSMNLVRGQGARCAWVSVRRASARPGVARGTSGAPHVVESVVGG